jgi:hypothetical protein
MLSCPWSISLPEYSKTFLQLSYLIHFSWANIFSTQTNSCHIKICIALWQAEILCLERTEQFSIQMNSDMLVMGCRCTSNGYVWKNEATAMNTLDEHLCFQKIIKCNGRPSNLWYQIELLSVFSKCDFFIFQAYHLLHGQSILIYFSSWGHRLLIHLSQSNTFSKHI